METLNAIFTRRSIRKFLDRTIPGELIQEVIKAGMYAPSARNTQPWHFIVINERKLLNKIPAIHPFADMCYQASHAILVCGDSQIEKLEGYVAINCAAATQNILLAAHDKGLGAVWLGVYPRKERMEPVAKMFELPENIIPVSLIALGYPAEIKDSPERFKEERIHCNKW